jgi:drug/metabolite transporter (DMT)-like permease
MITVRRLPPLDPAFPRPRLIPGPTPRVLAMVSLVGANVIWGGSAVASKAALTHLPPLTLACLRVGVALVVLRAVLAMTGNAPASGRGPALLGLTGVALFCASQNLGLRYSSAGTTALLNGAIPVLTALLAALFLAERQGNRRIAGLAVSFAGIAVIVLHGPGGTVGASALGNVLPLASAVSFAAYAVLGRRVFAGANALAVVAGSTRYGLLFLLPGAVVELVMGKVGPVTLEDMALVLYLGAGCSALAFVLGGYGMAALEAGHAAAFGNLKPLVGVALAVLLLGERLAADQFLGGALVLTGVAITSWAPGRFGRTVRPWFRTTRFRRTFITLAYQRPQGGTVPGCVHTCSFTVTRPPRSHASPGEGQRGWTTKRCGPMGPPGARTTS